MRVARFLTEIGVDAISVNPASIMRTIAAVREAESSQVAAPPCLAAGS
jgi:pyruvate,water dikinase